MLLPRALLLLAGSTQLLVIAAAPHHPALLLGPTANLQTTEAHNETDRAEIVRQLLLLVDGSGPASMWPATFAHVNGSGGTIHVRQQVGGRRLRPPLPLPWHQ